MEDFRLWGSAQAKYYADFRLRGTGASVPQMQFYCGGERGTKSGRRSAQELGKADGGSCYWGTAAVGNQTGSTSPKPGLGGEFLAVESLPGV